MAVSRSNTSSADSGTGPGPGTIDNRPGLSPAAQGNVPNQKDTKKNVGPLQARPADRPAPAPHPHRTAPHLALVPAALLQQLEQVLQQELGHLGVALQGPLPHPLDGTLGVQRRIRLASDLHSHGHARQGSGFGRGVHPIQRRGSGAVAKATRGGRQRHQINTSIRLPSHKTLGKLSANRGNKAGAISQEVHHHPPPPARTMVKALKMPPPVALTRGCLRAP